MSQKTSVTQSTQSVPQALMSDSLTPLRCQPMTVSGLTITRAWRQAGHRQDRMTQKTLSAFRSNGRDLFRFRTATCCRRARISVWGAARSAKISMILCMPARASGGDAKSQGFSDEWNKWEGQSLGARWNKWKGQLHLRRLVGDSSKALDSILTDNTALKRWNYAACVTTTSRCPSAWSAAST